MRESRIYLKFLKENVLIFVLTHVIALLLMGYYLYKYPPIRYTYQTQIIAEHDDQNAASRTLMIDEVVSLLRQQHVAPEVKISIYKASPFTVSIKSSSNTMHPKLVSVTKELISFSQSKYSFLEESEGDAFGKVNYSLIYLYATVASSILIALIISLIRHYIRYY